MKHLLAAAALFTLTGCLAASVAGATVGLVGSGVSLAGKTVGLLDISKPRGDVFLDRIEERLAEMDVTVKRYRKPTFTRVAPTELKQQIAGEVDLVVEGLAD